MTDNFTVFPILTLALLQFSKFLAMMMMEIVIPYFSLIQIPYNGQEGSAQFDTNFS